METALLFEHLIDEQLHYAQSWGAGLYRACFKESTPYEEGVRVGEVYALTQLATEKLLNNLSVEQQGIVKELLDTIPPTPKIDKIENFLTQLNHKNILA